MTTPSPIRRLLAPGLAALLGLAILLGLGVWQIQRLHWKHAILDAISAAEAEPAVPLGATPPAYAKVYATGRLRYDRAALYGAEGRDRQGQPVMGAQLLVPLDLTDGRTILCLLGWVAALPPRQDAPEGRVEGYVRPGDKPGLFSAPDDAPGRRFYTLDPAAIAAALRLDHVAPEILVAVGPPGDPDPARSLPRPPDNHLNYALTWFGLALSLIAVFIVFARKVLRS